MFYVWNLEEELVCFVVGFELDVIILGSVMLYIFSSLKWRVELEIRLVVLGDGIVLNKLCMI